MGAKRLNIYRIKNKPGVIKVWSANDVCKSGDVPSSMGACVDEPADRFMTYTGANKPTDKPNTINRHRIDDMYEAVDY